MNKRRTREKRLAESESLLITTTQKLRQMTELCDQQRMENQVERDRFTRQLAAMGRKLDIIRNVLKLD